MNSSERPSPPNPYARFIPREELDGFAAWRPNAFGDSNAAQAPPGDAKRGAEPQAAQVARQAGYQDGYRDGLVALESFKQSFAQQMAAQFAPLVSSFEQAFVDLESQIADGVARSATALARQVLRSELTARPELVAQVAGEALTARDARLLADASLTRGGCRVESDLGQIDARIETRWAQAAASLGQPLPLHDETAPT